MAETLKLPKLFGKCLNIRVDTGIKRITLPITPPQEEAKGRELIAYAEANLPQYGKLKVDANGYIYLDLPDDYIFELYTLLGRKEADPPPYFEKPMTYGAHVSVVLATEKRPILHLPELEKEIPFTITGCYSAEPENWEEIVRVWFLTINAPLLETIRTKLGLSPKIGDHEFHITFAVQKRYLKLTDVLVETENKAISLGTGDVTKSKVRALKNLLNRA